jgi:hypothetical protein
VLKKKKKRKRGKKRGLSKRLAIHAEIDLAVNNILHKELVSKVR